MAKYSSGERQNKASEVGMAKGHGHHPAEKVSSIEHVGTTSSHAGNMGRGVRFKMPTDDVVTDHSDVTRGKLGA